MALHVVRRYIAGQIDGSTVVVGVWPRPCLITVSVICRLFVTTRNLDTRGTFPSWYLISQQRMKSPHVLTSLRGAVPRWLARIESWRVTDTVRMISIWRLHLGSMVSKSGGLWCICTIRRCFMFRRGTVQRSISRWMIGKGAFSVLFAVSSGCYGIGVWQKPIFWISRMLPKYIFNFRNGERVNNTVARFLATFWERYLAHTFGYAQRDLHLGVSIVPFCNGLFGDAAKVDLCCVVEMIEYNPV